MVRLKRCIPKEVAYVYGTKSFVRYNIPLVNTFVVDASSERSMNTATEWARSQDAYLLSYEERKSKSWGELLESLAEPIKNVVPNDPIPYVTILGFECRGNGGRAWKTLLPNGHLVDMREDVLLEAMHKAGIEKGGKINADFVWSRAGNQMKLIRVDSPLYEASEKK